ncbi:response regulator [Kineococcus rhizosphaerae]|uniref:Transcriptional regulatory protein n=1 Tax=Kineococcus rhizosphaerae TaxID=559628 RepID=A0A2T0RAR8_9ACTN|nr:response regulator [Kineococcus rhizosphaerae]PRY18266.1 response regulator of citrate/malate metabolism [Kineococcus rhizosphaerae]
MLRVLVVDDDFRVASLHAGYVEAVAGFEVAGTAGSVGQARAVLARSNPVDLLLVDVYLPDGSGLDLLGEHDAIVATAAGEPATFRRAVRSGALGYLLKPFGEAVLHTRLRAYARYRRVLATAADHGQPLDQDVADGALRALHAENGAARSASAASGATRDLVLRALHEAAEPLSAADVAAVTGISRATAQRHLAALDGEGRLALRLRYGATGRPEQRYGPIG